MTLPTRSAFHHHQDLLRCLVVQFAAATQCPPLATDPAAAAATARGAGPQIRLKDGWGRQQRLLAALKRRWSWRTPCRRCLYSARCWQTRTHRPRTQQSWRVECGPLVLDSAPGARATGHSSSPLPLPLRLPLPH